MQRVFAFSILITAFAAAALPACASSQVPKPPISTAGDYECRIERVNAVSRAGKSYDMAAPPHAFTFSAYDTPITPEELQRPPRALNRYRGGETGRFNPEPVRPVSASISPAIFGVRAHSLRSYDRTTYEQFGVSISFKKDLSFFAFGPAPEDGSVAYAGFCSAPNQ